MALHVDKVVAASGRDHVPTVAAVDVTIAAVTEDVAAAEPLIVSGPSSPLKLSASAIPAVITSSAATNAATMVAFRMFLLLAADRRAHKFFSGLDPSSRPRTTAAVFRQHLFPFARTFGPGHQILGKTKASVLRVLNPGRPEPGFK
ncbi:MAG: hypothetical protein AVDCRST_MAG01-01-3830 [uncultured Rubrobacteraceae bacterium]|uniref:Uncharacterized protein n=1 Tax=uncultured Rubrobacteraceae bacterium TaxID=349277 RepID=A0A6J4QPC5_9ACTN|nr:MAG: hypothetical protein AVDCRST_MAG01-01-3830 [uncultured Rubrobacteraceae bacterium]